MPVTRRSPLDGREFADSPSVFDSAPTRAIKAVMDFLGPMDMDSIMPGPEMIGMAAGGGPTRRLLAKAGSRIAEGAQSSMGAANKIPRFRSALGTFIKHEGQWWRIAKQPADVTKIALELLPPGAPEEGEAVEVLARKLIDADEIMPKRVKPGK